jgi:hypothetical protein
MTGGFDSALAALAGSAIGGLTTLAVTWMTQRAQLRAALTARLRDFSNAAREELTTLKYCDSSAHAVGA